MFALPLATFPVYNVKHDSHSHAWEMGHTIGYNWLWTGPLKDWSKLVKDWSRTTLDRS
jgi:hypothetical protein